MTTNYEADFIARFGPKPEVYDVMYYDYWRENKKGYIAGREDGEKELEAFKTEYAILCKRTDELIQCQLQNVQLRGVLELVRSIISEGATVGFNYANGDWAERLFKSQGVTHKALTPPADAKIKELEAVENMRDEEIAHLREKHGGVLMRVKELEAKYSDVCQKWHEAVDAREDAARYHYLRTPKSSHQVLIWLNEPAIYVAHSWNELDAAIDAAINQQKGEVK